MDKETLITDMMHQATHDAALFRTYDDDYDVIDRDQVMRCLANLDDAIRQFNKLHNFARVEIGAQRMQEMKLNPYAVDAIFTALTIMQRNLQSAIEYEAKKVMESKRELEHFGGEK